MKRRKELPIKWKMHCKSEKLVWTNVEWWQICNRNIGMVKISIPQSSILKTKSLKGDREKESLLSTWRMVRREKETNSNILSLEAHVNFVELSLVFSLNGNKEKRLWMRWDRSNDIITVFLVVYRGRRTIIFFAQSHSLLWSDSTNVFMFQTMHANGWGSWHER